MNLKMRTVKRRQLALAAIATAGVMALTACSSSTNSTATTPSASPTTGTIVAVAAATPSLSTLVAAVQAAGLASTLDGAGPFTVFAPTNDAFAKLPAGVVDKLLLPCNKDALTKILTYHVVPAKVLAADIKPGTVATVEGQNVTLAASNNVVTVNGANVTTADVAASNGVVHVIDGVLLPPGVDPAALKASC
jgi:uncharacterized surface protein with fasciclin (FAS1) repeats